MSTQTTGWLSERNNDPYGTPSRHPFWTEASYWQVGAWRVVEHEGIAAAYDPRHNAWYTFPTLDAARAHAQEHTRPVDPWT